MGLRCTALATLLLLALSPTPVLAGEDVAATPEAPWFDQLTELGCQLFRNSNVNVINGLHLTRDQALRLKALAMKAADGGIVKPERHGALRPEVAQIVATFAEARQILLEGGEVGPELEKRILEARTLESEILRRGLRWEPERRSCARCHAEPTENGPFRPWNWGTLPPHVRAIMAEEHVNVFGARGSIRLTLLGAEVDEILTDNQKAVVSSFSCCLLPPRGMADPVRVGQASTAAWQEEMLEKARKVPASFWPAAKRLTLAKVAESARIVDPGLTPLQEAALKARVGEVLEKARSLSEIDFQLQRTALCEALELGPRPAPASSEAIQRFLRAFFLLFPGAEEAYEARIRRLDAQPALAPRDLEKEPDAGGGG